MNTYLQKNINCILWSLKKISSNAKTAMLFFKHHFCLLIGKEKYSCTSSRSIWRPKNNSYTADNLSQKHVTWHVCFFYDVSLIVFTRMMFFMFSLYFGRQSSCICNLVWWKKWTDQMLYQMHQFCNKSKMSNMRNETQMIKHFTCFRSSEKMSNYSNSATTRFIVKNSLFVPIIAR